MIIRTYILSWIILRRRLRKTSQWHHAHNTFDWVWQQHYSPSTHINDLWINRWQPANQRRWDETLGATRQAMPWRPATLIYMLRTLLYQICNVVSKNNQREVILRLDYSVEIKFTLTTQTNLNAYVHVPTFVSVVQLFLVRNVISIFQ